MRHLTLIGKHWQIMIKQAWAKQGLGTAQVFFSKTPVYVFRLGLRFTLTLAHEQQKEAWNGIELWYCAVYGSRNVTNTAVSGPRNRKKHFILRNIPLHSCFVNSAVWFNKQSKVPWEGFLRKPEDTKFSFN